MKKIALSLITTAILGFSSTITIEGFSSPESMIVNKDDLYVTNVGKELNPTLKDGDGWVRCTKRYGFNWKYFIYI